MKELVLAEFHQRLAYMMNEIHKICERHHIHYTMIGATLIGALRHKGFVPWDDDMDIAMPYTDYKRFCKIVFTEKHPWIDFDLAGYTDNYYCPFIKAYDSRTTFLEENRGIPKGIFIDIFPIVCVGDTKKEALREYKKHRFYQSLLKRKAYHFETGQLRECILTWAAKLSSVSFLMRRIDNHYECLNQRPSYFISDMDGTEKGIVPAYLFEEYTSYQFEGYTFNGIKKSDEYLQLIFGDYMQLPPKEQQQPHHIKFIDLDLPYRKYK